PSLRLCGGIVVERIRGFGGQNCRAVDDAVPYAARLRFSDLGEMEESIGQGVHIRTHDSQPVLHRFTTDPKGVGQVPKPQTTASARGVLPIRLSRSWSYSR